MTIKRLSPAIEAGLEAGARLLVPSAQRQAAVRAAWADQQRAAGRGLWATPRVATFIQFAENALVGQWAAAQLPDRLMPAGAEWALLRESCRESGGTAQARALHAAVRLLRDWRMPRSPGALRGSPEGDLLLGALELLDSRAAALGRKPLNDCLDELAPPAGELLVAGGEESPTAMRATLERLGARFLERGASESAVAVAAADDDEHEIELIGSWCRAQLERDPARRLLVVDAKLRQRRRQYERLLSQTLSPSEWVTGGRAREFSRFFSIEGGQPLTDFPLIAHALLTLRLLTGVLRFDEVLLWLRMPFLDGDDLFAGAVIEATLREGHRLEYSAASLAGHLEQAPGDAPRALATRLRAAQQALAVDRQGAPEWAPRLLAALRTMGWPGSRGLRTDEQQTVARWQALLDEYAALGAWLPRASAADAVATLADLARERSFDPASVEAPVTLTDSHDDPVVRYDGIWVAGLDGAQWPASPRPDAFIPLRLQLASGLPAASAAGQARRAQRSLTAWRAATDSLVCSWARLDGDAHRTPSPLLTRLPERADYPVDGAPRPLSHLLWTPQLADLDDTRGVPVNTAQRVRGGVKPLTLQAECGFHAYGEMRLGAEALEEPAPGIDPRERGMLLHKALELVWGKLDANFLTVFFTDELSRQPAIRASVQAAVAYVYRGYIPPELRPAVERETFRLERLIEALFREESKRTTFHIESLETRREVNIAGGTFEVRIDRIDSLQGGGFAILDYKTGEPRPLRWGEQGVRDPQLLAYLLAESGRDVQALANVSLSRGRARFMGKASRARLLPGVNGPSPAKVPAEEIEAAWRGELRGWVSALERVAAAYLSGIAPAQPAPDVCRNCHLTVLCRRVELAAGKDDAHG